MIDTNRYDGVMFPISMCVRELESRSKRMSGDKGMKCVVGKRDVREVSGEKTPFGKEVRLLLLSS